MWQIECIVGTLNADMTICWGHFATKAKNARMTQISPYVLYK